MVFTSCWLPRTQAHPSGFESDWDFGSALGIMERRREKRASHFSHLPFPASIAYTLNVPMVHCAILLDGSCSRVFGFPHLRRLGTRQPHRSNFQQCAAKNLTSIWSLNFWTARRLNFHMVNRGCVWTVQLMHEFSTGREFVRCRAKEAWLVLLLIKHLSVTTV